MGPGPPCAYAFRSQARVARAQGPPAFRCTPASGAPGSNTPAKSEHNEHIHTHSCKFHLFPGKLVVCVLKVSLRSHPYGGVPRFESPSIPGCYVTNVAPCKALNLFAWGKFTFDAMVVLLRLVSSDWRQSSPDFRGVWSRDLRNDLGRACRWAMLCGIKT